MEIIEGRNPVIEALKAGRKISKILVDRGAQHGVVDEIMQLAKAGGVAMEVVDGREIRRRSSTGASQGIIALAESRAYITLDDLFIISREKGEPAFYLVLDGVEDPHNLGAMLRTAEATGVHGVVIRERRQVGLTPAAVKASAGAAEYMPVALVANISQAVEKLKKNDVWVTGIDMDGEADYADVDFSLPSAIVIGGEGGGLSDLVRKRCDRVVSIPMVGRISSLNASVAAAVVMYAALRQRLAKKA